MISSNLKIGHAAHFFTMPLAVITISTSTYRRLWLISACAYSGKRYVSMRLINDMRLYGT